eukprot:3287814-Pyramimonas_sp.AAC.1
MELQTIFKNEARYSNEYVDRLVDQLYMLPLRGGPFRLFWQGGASFWRPVLCQFAGQAAADRTLALESLH